MTQPRKRFWKAVTLGRAGEDGQQGPLLDGRPVRLPAGAVLAVRSSALARTLVEEWQQIAEGATFTPDDLVLTRITGSFIERVLPDRAAMEAVLYGYGIDDNLCYRSEAQAAELVQRVLGWAAGQGLHPVVTDGLMPLQQPEPYQQALRRTLSAADPALLAALGVMVPLTSSLLLPLALVHGVITLEEATRLAHADEYQQMRDWGHDRELARQLEQKNADMADALRFWELMRQG